MSDVEKKVLEREETMLEDDATHAETTLLSAGQHTPPTKHSIHPCCVFVSVYTHVVEVSHAHDTQAPYKLSTITKQRWYAFIISLSVDSVCVHKCVVARVCVCVCLCV